MIRRLTAAVRRLTNRQPASASEPHSPWWCNWSCPDHREPHATDLVGLADGADHTEVCECHARPLTTRLSEPTALDKLDPWAWDGTVWDCGPDPLDPAPARPAVQHVPDVVERHRPTGVPTGGTR